MFGIGQQSPADEAARAVAVLQAKKTVRDLVHGMVDASPEDAERLSQRLKDFCGGDKLVPFDFKQRAFLKARELECHANMRMADRMLRDASRMAAAENMRERGVKLGDARRFFGKACTLGADEGWRKAFQRSSETVLLTGGVQPKGPTRAKPRDIAPRAPNRAKA